MPLPLKLVAFERYMLDDDRSSHPMAFRLKLAFSGRFDEDAFRAAVKTAVARHPLFRAHICSDRPRALEWTDAADAETYVDIADIDTPVTFPGQEQIDLRNETGVRIWVRTGPDATEIRFQLHHSCCDGIGAYRFAEDLLCAYDQQVHPEAGRSEYRPLDSQRLARRTQFGLSWWRVMLRLPLEIWGIVVGMFTFFVGRPVALQSPQQPNLSEDEQLRLIDYASHWFDEETATRLRAAARSAGVTLNDLLLRDLFLAIRDWNGQHDPRTRRRAIRLSVPMDLRGPGDEQMPAANVVAMIFVDRRPAIFPNPRWLLKSINWEMRFIKWGRFGIAFVRACGLVDLIPGGLRLLSRANRCYATAVLSNMGRPFSDSKLARQGEKIITGDLVLEEVESAPPVRPYTSAALTCLSYAGRFALVMNYDRHHFTTESAEALLDTITQQIGASASDSGAATAPLRDVSSPQAAALDARK